MWGPWTLGQKAAGQGNELFQDRSRCVHLQVIVSPVDHLLAIILGMLLDVAAVCGISPDHRPFSSGREWRRRWRCWQELPEKVRVLEGSKG